VVAAAKTHLPSPCHLYLGCQVAKLLGLPIPRFLAFRSPRATDVGCLKYRRASRCTARDALQKASPLRILSRPALASTNFGGVAMSRSPNPQRSCQASRAGFCHCAIGDTGDVDPDSAVTALALQQRTRSWPP